MDRVAAAVVGLRSYVSVSPSATISGTIAASPHISMGDCRGGASRRRLVGAPNCVELRVTTW